MKINSICTICNKICNKICSNMQVFLLFLCIDDNMQNMQKIYAQYTKYVNSISICRICTPDFADALLRSRARKHSWHALLCEFTPRALAPCVLAVSSLRVPGGPPNATQQRAGAHVFAAARERAA